MWVAKFKLKDDEDIYSPLCEKYKIDFFAYPYTSYKKNNKIHTLIGGIIAGNNKKEFLKEVKKDKRADRIELSKDFILIHAVHPITRDTLTELSIFYDPEYIIVKPVHLSIDGWEYWEIACLDRNKLNKIINAAKKYYHGALFSIKEEKLKSITSLSIAPDLTDKQKEALQLALKEGYYNYPRKLTLPELAKIINKSYSTFQEHLRKAESKIINYFFNYR